MPYDCLCYVQQLINAKADDFRVPAKCLFGRIRGGPVSWARMAVVAELRSGERLITRNGEDGWIEFRLIEEGGKRPAERNWKKPGVLLVADVLGMDPSAITHIEEKIRTGRIETG